MPGATSRQNHSEALAGALVCLCAAVSPFTGLPLGLVGRIQPLEIGFLILLPVALVAYGRALIPPRSWCLVLGCYLAANLAAGIASGMSAAVVESLARVYLAALGWIVATFVRRTWPSGAERISQAWLVGGLLQAAVAVVGYALALGGIANGAVVVYREYPYVGTVLRATGFTNSPAMLLVVLWFPFLWLWAGGGRPSWRLPALVLLGAAQALTVAKELVLLPMGMALLHPAIGRKGPWPGIAITGLTALALWSSSHGIVVRGQAGGSSYLAGTAYTSGRVLVQCGDVQVMETCYTALKRAAWTIGLAHPLLGVGPGNFNREFAGLRGSPDFPDQLFAYDYDPHSTWTGAFAETGLLGLAALVLLNGAWIRLAASLEPPEAASPLRVARVFLLMLLIESVVIDAMNFRALWIAAGLLMGGDGGPDRCDPAPSPEQPHTRQS